MRLEMMAKREFVDSRDVSIQMYVIRGQAGTDGDVINEDFIGEESVSFRGLGSANKLRF
jgi:hypothetical protein